MRYQIRNNHPLSGYVVIFEDGTEVECKTIDEAIKIAKGE